MQREPNIRFTVNHPNGTSHELVGVYYAPAEAEEPHPFALFLHGIPGTQKNHDIAQTLQGQGWGALILHFSGAWGSGGDYDIPTQPADAIAALDHMLDHYPIDPHKIAVIGFSLGSWAAIMTAHQDARFGAIVSISGFCDFSEIMIDLDFFAEMPSLLRGSTAESLSAGFHGLGDGIQPHEAIKDLAPRPVLVVHGTEDEIVPFFHADTLAMGGEHVSRLTIEHADHGYERQRGALIEGVVVFLCSWGASK